MGINKICVQWPRFGPYHIARLDALDSLAISEGVEMIGLETSGSDRLYEWKEISDRTNFRRVQVFPAREFESITPRVMHRGVIQTLDRLQPDAVLATSYSFPDARACLTWCRRNRRIAVFMTDTFEASAPRTPWRERLKSLLINQFDAALLSGTPHRAYYTKLGFPEAFIFLTYSVVDNAYFRAGAARAAAARDQNAHLPGLESTEPFFLASGRFIRRKNFATLIRAYARYRRERAHGWRLVIIGDGALKGEIEQLIATTGAQDVTLAGFRQIEDLPAYYGLAGAFVHPAANEPWGLVVNEAMASGLPVIVSKQTGCARDLVRESQNGFVFDAEDEHALASALEYMSSDAVDQKAMRKKSLEIIEKYSPEHFAQQAWAAIQAGRERSGRSLEVIPAALIWATKTFSRSVSAFHTVEA